MHEEAGSAKSGTQSEERAELKQFVLRPGLHKLLPAPLPPPQLAQSPRSHEPASQHCTLWDWAGNKSTAAINTLPPYHPISHASHPPPSLPPAGQSMATLRPRWPTPCSGTFWRSSSAMSGLIITTRTTTMQASSAARKSRPIQPCGAGGRVGGGPASRTSILYFWYGGSELLPQGRCGRHLPPGLYFWAQVVGRSLLELTRNHLWAAGAGASDSGAGARLCPPPPRLGWHMALMALRAARRSCPQPRAPPKGGAARGAAGPGLF